MYFIEDHDTYEDRRDETRRAIARKFKCCEDEVTEKEIDSWMKDEDEDTGHGDGYYGTL